MSLLDHQDPWTFRRANRLHLAAALADSRERLLRLADAYARCLPPDQAVRYLPEVNPPRWQLGHAGWYEEAWLARNPLRRFGDLAPWHEARGASVLPQADALFDPARQTQPRRWHLDLPTPARLRRYLAQVREKTAALLDDCDDSDAALYPFRVVVLHADRLVEDWAAMGQALALPVGDGLDAHMPAPGGADGEIELAGGRFEIGAPAGGFALDCERAAHGVELEAFRIDRQCVSWARYLPFVEDGGYDRQALWSDAGWAWRQRHGASRPRYLTREDGVWQRAAFAQWTALDPAAPAVHLSHHEAEAWCRWAGRRLPSEAEWEVAAITATGPEGLAWGQVREWTASPFVPYEGFEPAPDRSMSMPQFDGRPAVRGTSFAASPRWRHPHARSGLAADRNDAFTGFRSCALA